MLPDRTNLSLWAAALVGGQFLAATSLAQTHGPLIPDGTTQQEPYAIGAEFKLGAAAIELDRRSATAGLHTRPADMTDQSDISGATFTLTLPETQAGQTGSRLFPLSLSITTHKSDLFGGSHFSPRYSFDPAAGQNPDGEHKSDYRVSADWGSPEDKFTFSFSSRAMGERLGNGETADFGDEMLNFTRTLRTGGWLSSFTASVGRGYREETGHRERSQKFGASANFKTLEDSRLGFDITAKVLQDRTVKLDPGTGDVDTRWELRTGSRIFGAPSHDTLTTQPSLSIFFSVKGNAPDEEDEDTNPVDFTAGVTGKVHF